MKTDLDVTHTPPLPIAATRGPTERMPDETQEAVWEQEKERLLHMLAHQQRIAQTGLITAGLSHEISNHIVVITGLTYAARRARDPSQWQAALEKIEERCNDAAETLRTFLSFAGRREERDPVSFSIAKVIQQAERLLRPMAISHGVSIDATCDADAMVSGDPRLAVQLLVNLGSNAIKACRDKVCRVQIRATRRDAAALRLEVCDDGPGIPGYLRRRIFRPFVTGCSKDGGRGMGLFIVRQAARRLGGSIRVRSSASGTCFGVDLPAMA